MLGKRGWGGGEGDGGGVERRGRRRGGVQQGLWTRSLRCPHGRFLVLTMNLIVNDEAPLGWVTGSWVHSPGMGTSQGYFCNFLCVYSHFKMKSKAIRVHVCVHLGACGCLGMCVCTWMCASILGCVCRAGKRRFLVVTMQSRVYSPISAY